MRREWIPAVALGSLLLASGGGAGEIDPNLLAVMNTAGPDSLIPTAFVLTSQLDLHALPLEGLGRKGRRALLITALKGHADASQIPILVALQSPGPGQIVEDVGSTWITNAVYGRANVSAIEALASRADVRVATLDVGDVVPEMPASSQSFLSEGDIEHARGARALRISKFAGEPSPMAPAAPSRARLLRDGSGIDIAFERHLVIAASESLVSVIIFLTEQAPIATLDAELRAEGATLQVRHERVVTALMETAAATQGPLLAELAAAQLTGAVIGFTPYWIANLIVAQMTVETVLEIADRLDVAAIEPNFTVSLIEPVEGLPKQGEPVGMAVEATPGLRAINAPRVWNELGVNGAGRLVAGIDTGVRGSHDALESRWRGSQSTLSSGMDAMTMGRPWPRGSTSGTLRALASLGATSSWS
jgi:hypothetical protein